MARTRDGGKWAVIFILVLAVIAVLVSGILTDWYTEGNKFCLFGHTYGEDNKCIRCGVEDELVHKPEEPVVTDDEGNAMASDKVYDMPQGIVFASAAPLYSSAPVAMAEERTTYPSVTVKANVEPEEASALAYTWTVAFKNPSSTWANGKNVTDYVTVTPNPENYLQATITCSQEFGEQIIVKIKSNYNDVSASCTVDYKQRIVSGTVKFLAISNNNSVDCTCTVGQQKATGFLAGTQSAQASTGYKIVIDVLCGVGTIGGSGSGFAPSVYFESQGASSQSYYDGDIVYFDEMFWESQMDGEQFAFICLSYNGRTDHSWYDTPIVETPQRITVTQSTITF